MVIFTLSSLTVSRNRGVLTFKHLTGACLSFPPTTVTMVIFTLSSLTDRKNRGVLTLKHILGACLSSPPTTVTMHVAFLTFLPLLHFLSVVMELLSQENVDLISCNQHWSCPNINLYIVKCFCFSSHIYLFYVSFL